MGFNQRTVDFDRKVRDVIDEDDGIELKAYLIDNKLYSTFEVQGQLLTTSYRFNTDNIEFEILGGPPSDTTGFQVVNYGVNFLQRVVLTRTHE